MTAADPRAAMLAEMCESACRLGMAFAAEAERAEDVARKVEWFRLFDRCFFAVRVSTALELRLQRQPQAPREAASDREDLSDRADPPDPEDWGRGYDERDREQDREVERASFPILLRTLEGVVAEASALPGPAPAALLTLHELLARMSSDPRPAPVARLPAATLRARLAGSGASALALAPRPAPKLPGPSAGRRATGPPGR